MADKQILVRPAFEEWAEKHSECGGRFVIFDGKYEFRIGCTCGDKE
jgi:hypothetical protein